jgi:hypothetical protein
MVANEKAGDGGKVPSILRWSAQRRMTITFLPKG